MEKYYVTTKNQNQKVVKDVISSFDQSQSKKKSKNAEDFSMTSKSRNVHLRMRKEIQTNMKDNFSQTEDFIFSSLLAEKQINGIFKHAPALPSSLSCQVYFFFHLPYLYLVTQGLLDISNSSSFDEPSVLDIDNIGIKANEAENALKIIIPTPKSKFSQMRTNLKDKITKNYLQLTAELLKIVNENRFQHFIRICIILNSLR